MFFVFQMIVLYKNILHQHNITIMSKRRVWTYERLNNFATLHGITFTENYEGQNLNGETRINGNCKTEGCNGVYCKSFTNLFTNETFYCPQCETINRTRKRRATFMITQGTTHPMKNPKVVEKQNQTNLIRHGHKCAMKNPDIVKRKEENYFAKTGVRQPFANPSVRAKAAATNIKRRGVACPFSCPLARKKGELTMIKLHGVAHNALRKDIHEENQRLYGVKYTIQRPDVRKKSEETHMKRRGVKSPFACPIVKQKIAKTHLKRRGVPNPAQDPSVILKAQKTSMLRYSCKNPMQHPLIFQRAMKKAYSRKPYVFPSGKCIMVQGYEPLALDRLIKDIKIDEKDIVTGTKNVPKINYKTDDGKDHIHFPDIYIPNQNWIIEVKSTWTVGIEKDNVFLKLKSAREQGYKYNIVVFNKKKELVAIH